MLGQVAHGPSFPTGDEETMTKTLLSLLMLLAIHAAVPALAEDQPTEPAADVASDAATGAATDTPAVPQDQLLTIINNSGSMLMDFFVTPAVAPDAETTADAPPAQPYEILGEGVVSSGSYGTVRVPGGATQCTYDIRALLRDGREIVENINICASDVYTING
jgi:hypothetical protein